ncbi:photosystem I Ycf4, assembly [Artemisia annua]|uniref:Photosystem I assembly protein Ycf4 n=1 Tax=Artemisia annua TaxID=35608 RepID=A0A2U1QCF9_ARTAN|nr:photosystem I Ycf4, assembly [Artemisia annua]
MIYLKTTRQLQDHKLFKNVPSYVVKDVLSYVFKDAFDYMAFTLSLHNLINDIKSVKIEVKEGIYACRVLYTDIKGQGDIPLTHTDENFTPWKMEEQLSNWPISCVYQLKLEKIISTSEELS